MIALVYVLASSGYDAGLVLIRVAVIIGFQAFLVGVVLVSILLGGGAGGDEPESDDDGPGWRRPEPRRPPPEPHISWPDFERQFAEHVEAMKARDKVPTA